MNQEVTNPDKLTNWVKEPTLEDLKYDFQQAQVSHTTQTARIVTGKQIGRAHV